MMLERNENEKKGIKKIGEILNDSNQPMKARFRALFTLRNLGGQESLDEMSRCLVKDDSILLKHEVAFCMGQMGDENAIPVLSTVLQHIDEHPMVRHEAGEALGAIGSEKALDVLQKHSEDSYPEVSETCHLAVKRINWLSEGNKIEDLPSNPYLSVDPTPPSENTDVAALGIVLIDENKPLWERYRAMFTLRNIGSNEAVLAIAKGLFCKDSALFRHEIAYVLGQIQSSAATNQLHESLKDSKENSMVRHECAEALGAIGTAEAEKILKEFLNDEERVVKESCEVALDISDYENSKDFQYANSLLSAIKSS